MSIARMMTTGGVLLAAALTMTACSSSQSAPTEPASSPAAATASAEPSSAASDLVGGNPGTWSPVQLTMDMNAQIVDLVVGQAVLFADLPEMPEIDLQTSDPAVMAVHLPTDDGTMQTAAGLQAVGVGAAHVIVWDKPKDQGGEPIVQYVFQVTREQGEGNGGPMVIDQTATKVELFSGQWLVIADMPAGAYAAPADDMVLWSAVQDDPEADPSMIAVGAGATTVTVTDAEGKEIFGFEVTVTPAP